MKVLLLILSFILVLAILFFIFNYDKLEQVFLDNGIGSYGAVNVDLYNRDDIVNVNVYHSTPVASNYIGDFDLVIYLNQMTLDNPVSSADYPNLFAFIEQIENSEIIGLNDYNDLIIRLSRENFTLPKEPPSNIPMTPARFYELYPNGLEVVIYNFKSSKIIMGVDTQDTIELDLEPMNCKIYCAPNPEDMSTYILTCIPYEYSYEYNFFTTLEVLGSDLEAIKAAKPNLDNVNYDNDSLLDWVKGLFTMVSHPVRMLKYYTSSVEIIISDFSGILITNEFESYSPF